MSLEHRSFVQGPVLDRGKALDPPFESKSNLAGGWRSWRGDLGGKFFSFSGFPRGPLVVLARERSANKKNEVEETDEGRNLKWSS